MSSARIYRISLTTWGWMLTGEPVPTGPARRGAKPPVFPVAATDDPALPEVLPEVLAEVLAELAASRRALSTAGRIRLLHCGWAAG